MYYRPADFHLDAVVLLFSIEHSLSKTAQAHIALPEFLFSITEKMTSQPHFSQKQNKVQ
jgi:hypothetical protein